MEYYVAPNGNDSWSGTLPAPNVGETDGPFKTLQGAQFAVRSVISGYVVSPGSRQAININIQPGTYYMTSPLSFSQLDSGVIGKIVTWKAVTAGTVIISGGFACTNDAEDSTQVTFGLPVGVATPDWPQGQQLYVNGKRAALTRSPSTGYWFINQPVQISGETGLSIGTHAFSTNAAALSFVQGLNPTDFTNAIVNIFHSWTTSRHRLSTGGTGTIQVSPAAPWPFKSFAQYGSQRFFIENVSTSLDTPGEFYGSGTSITYKKRAGESGPVGIIPQLDALISIIGSAGTLQWAQYITFSGLSFQHTRFLTGAGVTDNQACSAIGAAVDVNAAQNVVFDNCNFSHLGGFAVWFRNRAVNCTLSNSTITDCMGGAKIGLTVQLPDANPTSTCTITRCTITDIGHIMPGAPGIWIGQSWGNTISNNTIVNTKYSGISVGWTWGYASIDSGNNTIQKNLLYNIGQGVLSDMGGIYTLGISPGTIVSSNVIRNVRAYGGYGPGGGYGAWGVYNDFGSSNIVSRYNIVIGTDNGGYLLNGGRDNTLVSNVFALGDVCELYCGVTDTLTNLNVSSNLFFPITEHPFPAFSVSPDTIFSGNSISGTGYVQGTSRAIGARLGLELLIRCTSTDTLSKATLSFTSTPLSIVFANVAITDMVNFSATLANAGSGAVLNEVVGTTPILALAPPWPLTIDFDSVALGSQPPGFTYHPAADPSIAVAATTGSGGPASGQALQFLDSTSFLNQYEPYVENTKLNHASGTSTITFKIKLDVASEFYHEWRDVSSPFLAGPSFNMSIRGLEVGGVSIIPLSTGTWYAITVVADLGAGAGVWSVSVTDPTSSTSTVSNIPNKTAAWQALNWLVFLSNSTVSSITYLGTVNITNTNSI
jgi:parallel beta-helix repeat protein